MINFALRFKRLIRYGSASSSIGTSVKSSKMANESNELAANFKEDDEQDWFMYPSNRGGYKVIYVLFY